MTATATPTTPTLRGKAATRDTLIIARFAAIGLTLNGLDTYTNAGKPKSYCPHFSAPGDPGPEGFSYASGRTIPQGYWFTAHGLDTLAAVTGDPIQLAWHCWRVRHQHHARQLRRDDAARLVERDTEHYGRAAARLAAALLDPRAAHYGHESRAAMLRALRRDRRRHLRTLAESTAALVAINDQIAAIVGPEPPVPAVVIWPDRR